MAPIVVAGALLEARLRALVQQAGATVTGTPGLSKYIDTLKQAGTITKLEWKELGVLAELRNLAAHGIALPNLTRGQAQQMADGVAKFLQAHA